MAVIPNRVKNAWNQLAAYQSAYQIRQYFAGQSSARRPDRHRMRYVNQRSITSVIFNKIAVDVSQMDIKHVKTNENGQYKETINGSLNYMLTKSANIDQTGRQLIQDIVMSMFDEGCIAVVPILTTINPDDSESFQVYTARVGEIVEWYPQHVRVRVYDERDGKKKEIVVPKSTTPIIENPFYAIMNEPNSTIKQLIKTISNMESINDKQSSGRLDLIIQLPYALQSQARINQAEERKRKIEEQLTNSPYGIAYIDGTEKIVQLNRALENQLWQQVQDLTQRVENQLGMTEAILNGTADEKENLNYINETLTPILTVIVEEFERKWLSKTAVTQGQAIKFFRDPFKLVPVSQLADIADKFTRNEVASSNEMRTVLGWMPSSDPRADELRNKNINQSNNGEEPVRVDNYEEGETNSQYERY